MDDEQSLLLQSIINLTSSKTAAEFIAASLPLFDVCNVDDKDAFIFSVLEHFDAMRPSSDIPSKDYGVKIYIMLRGSKSPVTEFLSSFCVVSPHSMSVERCVSTYNICYSYRRTSTETDTMNDRLQIYWNGVPTAQYNPRSAVETFLTKKERRMHLPEESIYRNMDFVKKFFNCLSSTALL